MVSLSEVERRQQYLDKMTMEAAVLKEMVMQCLDADPDQRPPIQEVSKLIKSLKVMCSYTGKNGVLFLTCFCVLLLILHI